MELNAYRMRDDTQKISDLLREPYTPPPDLSPNRSPIADSLPPSPPSAKTEVKEEVCVTAYNAFPPLFYSFMACNAAHHLLLFHLVFILTIMFSGFESRC